MPIPQEGDRIPNPFAAAWGPKDTPVEEPKPAAAIEAPRTDVPIAAGAIVNGSLEVEFTVVSETEPEDSPRVILQRPPSDFDDIRVTSGMFYGLLT